jgi:succinyl-diaminopimelate desuccinylase
MDVSQICSDLVRIKSENPPGSTAGVIAYIEKILTERGIESTVTECETGRCNLVTEPSDTGLLLCGHVDVVPALDEGWSVGPYSGTIRDGAVWGRGATDMKGGCAALLSAFLAYTRNKKEIPAQIAFVCDEETGGECGIRHLIAEKLIAPCDCLIAEPTPALHPNIGEKGLLRLEMKFSGSPGHGSLYPAVGRSAIAEALSFVQYLQTIHERKFHQEPALEEILAVSSSVLAEEFALPHVSEVLTRIMFNPGRISGGEKSNIIAQQCDLDVELRIPWGCDIPALLQELKSRAPCATVVSETYNTPSLTDPDSRIAVETYRAIRSVYGGTVTPIVQWAASDARHMRSAGFNVVEYGPGELRYLHAIDEHVKISSLQKAVNVYSSLLDAYTGPDQTHS